MPEITDRLALPTIAGAQAQKHVTHNEALLDLDALVQPTVRSTGSDTAPATPEPGECHVVGTDPQGLWAGRAGAIAQFTAGSWRFHAPRPGWTCRVEDDGRLLLFDGSAWVEEAGTASDSLERLGLGQPVDPNHRLAVTGTSVRLAHAGGSHRVYVDKAAPAETASVVFQDAGSDRAEIGLAGDDAFRIRTSADGANWSTAATFRPGSTTLAYGTQFAAGGGAEGGELRLARPEIGSTLGSDVVLDVVFNTVRIFDGSNGNGFLLDLGAVQGQAHVWHSDSDLRLRSYAPGTLPTPAIGAGTLAYLTENPASVVFSDGTAWRRMHDRSRV